MTTIQSEASQGCTISGARLSRRINLTVAPNICGSSVCVLLQVTLLESRILRRLLEFWEICSVLRSAIFPTSGKCSWRHCDLRKGKISNNNINNNNNKGKKVKFTLQQPTKAQRGSRGIALLVP